MADAEQAPSQNSPHSTHGWFFPRRRGSRIATITRWSGQTETGRAIPRATPHARGSRESTSDRYIKPEGRPFRVPGSQHVRVTAWPRPLRPLRREGPAPATPLVFE